MRAVHALTGVYPRNIVLYRLALTHRSVASTVKSGFRASNERLEFLGDAVISTVVAKYLFQRFPFEDEGFLTEVRSRLVSRKVLNELSRRIGLPNMVNRDMPGLRNSSSLPGDAFEALVGALFIDRGYKCAEGFMMRCISNGLIDVETIILEDDNFKSRVIEWCQRNKLPFNFETIDESATGHDTLFTMQIIVDGRQVGMGQEWSKKKAEQIAAKEACATLAID